MWSNQSQAKVKESSNRCWQIWRHIANMEHFTFYRSNSHLSEVSSETTMAFSHLEIWREEKGAREEQLLLLFFNEMDAAYIQALRLNSVKSSQRNMKQKAGASPTAWEKDRGLTGEKRRGRGGEFRGRFKPATSLLGSLRKIWKLCKNNLQIILEIIRYYVRELWGSRNRIWFQKLLSKMN